MDGADWFGGGEQWWKGAEVLFDGERGKFPGVVCQLAGVYDCAGGVCREEGETYVTADNDRYGTLRERESEVEKGR